MGQSFWTLIVKFCALWQFDETLSNHCLPVQEMVLHSHFPFPHHCHMDFPVMLRSEGDIRHIYAFQHETFSGCFCVQV